MSNMGTYIIRHEATGVFYVGSTKNYSHRRAQHVYLLRRGRHYSELLQKAWDSEQNITWEFMPAETRERGRLSPKKQNKKCRLLNWALRHPQKQELFYPLFERVE